MNRVDRFRAARRLVLMIIIGMSAWSGAVESNEALLEQLIAFDDASSTPSQRDAAFSELIEAAGHEPLVCVELIRRLWRVDVFHSRIKAVLKDADHPCGKRLPELIVVLRGTDDDSPATYGLLTPDQMTSNADLIKDVIVNGNASQAGMLVRISGLVGLTEFSDAIAEGVVSRKWSPYDSISFGDFAGGSSWWELVFGRALLGLERYENAETRRKALALIRTSLMSGGHLEEDLSAQRLLEDIEKELEGMRSEAGKGVTDHRD